MVPGGQQSQRNRGNHEDDGTPGRDLGEQGSGAARAKGRLAAHAAKGGGNISALAVLQQHNDDQDHANDHMNGGEKNNEHAALKIPFKLLLVRKGGFEPPRLSAPPPQDGVSASSTTSALVLNRPISALVSARQGPMKNEE